MNLDPIFWHLQMQTISFEIVHCALVCHIRVDLRGHSTTTWTEFGYLLLWHLKSTCFCLFFGENRRHQKTITKLSDLYSKHWLHIRLQKYKVSPYASSLCLMARGLPGERIEKILLHDIYNEIFLIICNIPPCSRLLRWRPGFNSLARQIFKSTFSPSSPSLPISITKPSH